MNDLDKNFEEFKWLDDNNMLIIPFVIKVKINKKSKNIKIINSYKIHDIALKYFGVVL